MMGEGSALVRMPMALPSPLNNPEVLPLRREDFHNQNIPVDRHITDQVIKDYGIIGWRLPAVNGKFNESNVPPELNEGHMLCQEIKTKPESGWPAEQFLVAPLFSHRVSFYSIKDCKDPFALTTHNGLVDCMLNQNFLLFPW